MRRIKLLLLGLTIGTCIFGLIQPVAAKPAEIRVVDGLITRNGLALKVITRTESTVQTEPEKGAPVSKKVGVFEFLYVFSPEDEGNGGGGKTKNGFYRVGNTPSKNTIIGWISEEDVQEWDHREVVKFSPLTGRTTARVYKSKDDLKVVLAAKNLDAKPAIAQELPSTSTKKYKVLMPILDIAKENVEGKLRIFNEVAFLDSPKFSALPDKEASELVKKHGQLDIVFVIDTTRSMQEYIEGIKEAVRLMSTRFNSTENVNAKFGLVGYRDRIVQMPQANMEYIAKTFTPLTQQETFLEALSQMNAIDNVPSEGTPEAVFDGLNEALSEGNMGWREHGVKAIILIGDASANDQQKNPEGFSINGLLKTAKEQRVRIIAIKIDGEDPNDYPKHIRQFKELAQGVDEGARGAYLRVQRGPESVAEYVDKLRERMENEVNLTDDLIKFAMEQATSGVIPQQPANMAREEYMVLLRLLDTSLGGHKSQNVKFSTGWIQSEMEGLPVIETHVMMTDEELEYLLWFLDGLYVGARKKATAMSKIMDVFIKDLEKVAGEAFDEKEQTFADFLQKQKGIPVQSRLLRFTIQEMREWSDRKRSDTLEGVNKKAKVLRLFWGDQENWIKITEDYRFGYVPVGFLP